MLQMTGISHIYHNLIYFKQILSHTVLKLNLRQIVISMFSDNNKFINISQLNGGRS